MTDGELSIIRAWEDEQLASFHWSVHEDRVKRAMERALQRRFAKPMRKGRHTYASHQSAPRTTWAALQERLRSERTV